MQCACLLRETCLGRCPTSQGPLSELDEDLITVVRFKKPSLPQGEDKASPTSCYTTVDVSFAFPWQPTTESSYSSAFPAGINVPPLHHFPEGEEQGRVENTARFRLALP